MDDLISRQAAIDEVEEWIEAFITHGHNESANDAKFIRGGIEMLPPVQPEPKMDEWCHDCKEYDNEKHCCPRFNRVISEVVKEVKENVQPEPKTGHWIKNIKTKYISNGALCGFHADLYCCSECNYETTLIKEMNFCPNCGSFNGGNNEV